MKLMRAVATASMIRREIGNDQICVLTFDRPESGANIFDDATLDELNEHLDFIENDAALRGLIIASAKKSIFIAGADLKTLLHRAISSSIARVKSCAPENVRWRGELLRARRRRSSALHGDTEIPRQSVLGKSSTRLFRFRLMNPCGRSWTQLSISEKWNRRRT